MDVRRVAVVGSGTMGNGIAHVFAAAGFDVTLVDVTQALLDKALGTIRGNMQRQVAKGTLSQPDMDAAVGRLKGAVRPEDAAAAQLVIEAVPEKLDLKREVFAKLDRACPPETILATNTSSIPIASLAEATQRPTKVVGMHFMNPVPVMKLVEIIRGAATSDATYDTVRALTLKLGKVPVCSKDSPGFISNRVLMPLINEAIWTLHEGVATREDIDTVMKLGMNHPMGPLTLADYIGLDVCLSVMHVIEDGFGNPKYKACPLLEDLVKQGRLGRKSGRGFYDYDAAPAAAKR
ncbi:MAG: 3-hydroxybutyryl-CoA dehydrogenase [Proteobacteria bacterium]|nr:3-hydroxybutyryl-CoA dehydrogenase [Pseudomonadota bacterium]